MPQSGSVGATPHLPAHCSNVLSCASLRSQALRMAVIYGCEEVYVGLEQRQIEAVVKYPNYDAESTRRPVKPGQYDRFAFRLSADESTLICPSGHMMRVIRTEEAYTRSGFRSDSTVMTCDHCNRCPFRDKCILTKSKRGDKKHRKIGLSGRFFYVFVQF